MPGSADDKSGSADNKPGSTSNHAKAVWEDDIILGIVAGARREIIASTDRSMIFKTHVFSCILIYLYSCPFTHSISGLAAGGAWEHFEVRLKITIE